MNTEKIIKNLSKMDTSELKMICREMQCKVGSKKQMIARLVAPLLKGKYKFQMGKNLNVDTLKYVAEFLDCNSLVNLINQETELHRKAHLQGVLNSIVGFTSVIGPISMSYIFSIGAKNSLIYIPGAPFLFAGCLFFASLFLIRRFLT